MKIYPLNKFVDVEPSNQISVRCQFPGARVSGTPLEVEHRPGPTCILVGRGGGCTIPSFDLGVGQHNLTALIAASTPKLCTACFCRSEHIHRDSDI